MLYCLNESPHRLQSLPCYYNSRERSYYHCNLIKHRRQALQFLGKEYVQLPTKTRTLYNQQPRFCRNAMPISRVGPSNLCVGGVSHAGLDRAKTGRQGRTSTEKDTEESKKSFAHGGLFEMGVEAARYRKMLETPYIVLVLNTHT
jgi:hypothetical protein